MVFSLQNTNINKNIKSQMEQHFRMIITMLQFNVS